MTFTVAVGSEGAEDSSVKSLEVKIFEQGLTARIKGSTEKRIGSNSDPLTLDGSPSNRNRDNKATFAWTCGVITLEDETVSDT